MRFFHLLVANAFLAISTALVILPRPELNTPKSARLTSALFSRLPSSTYDDNIVRTKLFPMSAAAYSDSPEQCLHTVFKNASLELQVTKICDWDRDNTCSAFVAISHDDKAIIIAFRGTSNFIQLITEAGETLNEHVDFIAGGKVSKYFFDAFNIVWRSGIKRKFELLRKEFADYDLWITGHSLGGSMASLCAATIVKRGLIEQEKVKLVTLGQPRTGNKAYAQAHDQLLSYSFRVVNERDMVVHLPYLDFENFHHHKSEVWYENDMLQGDAPTSICDAGESDECSNGLIFTLSVPDHLRYFGQKVSKFGHDSCIAESEVQ